MIRRSFALVFVMFSLLITGCSQVEQAATDAANDAISGAQDAASQAASDDENRMVHHGWEATAPAMRVIASSTVPLGQPRLTRMNPSPSTPNLEP